MTTKLLYILSLPVVAVLSIALAMARPQECVICIDPLGTPLSTCTPISNPKKGTAGLQGGAASLELLRAGAGFYSWNPSPSIRDGFPAHAMLRDRYQTAKVVSGTLQLGGTGEWIWGVNEPDYPFPAGSLLTVAEVVQMEAIKEALAPSRLNGSPAYSQNSYTRLALVYDEFESTYGRPPSWDAVMVHCYWFSDDESFCLVVLDWAKQFAISHDIPHVIVSEFGTCAPYLDSASRFIDFLNSDSMVLYYFWYPFGFDGCNMSLVSCGSAGCVPTLLGQMYAEK